MRFKKGTKVEVLKNEDFPISWRCAEIISGNGHSYTVRYDDCLGTMRNEILTERVSRNAIRPCPPPTESVDIWLPGDIVEVFDGYSWKITTILKALKWDYYLVRLLGCAQEFTIHRSSIRVRLYWKDGKWVVMGKGSAYSGDTKFDKTSVSNCNKNPSFPMPQADARIGLQTIDGYSSSQESRIVPLNKLKRPSPPYRSSHRRNAKKRRAIAQKVDNVAYPIQYTGEKHMLASFNNRTNGLVGRSDSDDACSVASCSVNTESSNTFSSDAESVSGDDRVKNCALSPKEDEVEDSIHRLELNAYSRTIEALYASGILSWEKEELLTNLRIMLHISNDEHLTKLRTLISGGGDIRSR